MQRTQRSISIRKQIISKLKLNQIEGNPICPVNKPYRLKTGKPSKRIPTIEEEIFSTTSIKLIKPYNTEKLISIEPSQYSICSVLKSPSYQKLQKKIMEMISGFSKEKKQLAKDIKAIDCEIEHQTQKATDLCKKLLNLDSTYDRLENQYYETKRQNYELRAELSARHHNLPLWNIEFNRQPFSRQQQIDLDHMSYEQILEMEQRLGKHNIGMNKDSIAKLECFKFKDLTGNYCKKEDVNCCICCDKIEGEDSVIRLNCEHTHHAACISEWLKIKRFCPLCKAEVTLN